MVQRLWLAAALVAVQIATSSSAQTAPPASGSTGGSVPFTLPGWPFGLPASGSSGNPSSGNGTPTPPLAYPTVTTPIVNPTTPTRITLGKMLFWDEQMSSDNTMACGTCHRPAAGWADPRSALPESIHPGIDLQFGTADDRRGSPGIVKCLGTGLLQNDGVFFPRPQVTSRRAPSVADAMFFSSLFWDGRSGGAFTNPELVNGTATIGAALEAISLVPMLNSNEMAAQGRTAADIVAKLSAATALKLATNVPADIQALLATSNDYDALFTVAFGPGGISEERIARALASYMRTLKSDQTPYDLFLAGQLGALTPAQVQGLSLFRSKGCAVCHTEALMTDLLFTNNGLTDTSLDTGRMEVTNIAADFGKFKAPSLRNVGLRESSGMMHDGSFTSLDAVLLAYDQGGQFPINMDPLIVPLGLTAAERGVMADFLRNGLTDPRTAAELPPFDRPLLASESGLLPLTGGSGFSGGGGSTPTMIARQPAFLGTSVTLGMAGGTAGAQAILALTTQPPTPGLSVMGIPIHIGLDQAPLLINRWLEGPTGFGNGFASATLPIPNLAAIANVEVYGQWFVLDPFAPLGIAASNGSYFAVNP